MRCLCKINNSKLFNHLMTHALPSCAKFSQSLNFGHLVCPLLRSSVLSDMLPRSSSFWRGYTKNDVLANAIIQPCV